MKKLFISIFLVPLMTFGQSGKLPACSKLKNGIFYFYPPGNPKGFTLIRKGGLQTEIDHLTRDTSVWKINWRTACEFDVRFIQGSRPLSQDERKFYDSHITVFQILKIEKQYYLFRGSLDSINNPKTFTDTVWLKAR